MPVNIWQRTQAGRDHCRKDLKLTASNGMPRTQRKWSETYQLYQQKISFLF